MHFEGRDVAHEGTFHSSQAHTSRILSHYQAAKKAVGAMCLDPTKADDLLATSEDDEVIERVCHAFLGQAAALQQG